MRIDSSTILVLIPIIFLGIIAISAVGSLEEKTRGGRISKFFSIASNAAIFFTVLALLYQVIDSQDKAKHDAYSQLLGTYYQISQMQLDHPEIFDVIYPGVEYNRIGNDEKVALQYTYALLDFFDRVYIMHRDGVIDNEMWKRWESWIIYSFTASGFFLKAWNSNCALYHAEFINYIEQNFGDGSCGAAGSDVDIPPSRQPATPTR